MVLQGDRRVVIRCQGLGAGWEDPQMSPRAESDRLEALFELDTVDLICPCLWGPIALTGPSHQAPTRAGPASGGSFESSSCPSFIAILSTAAPVPPAISLLHVSLCSWFD